MIFPKLNEVLESLPFEAILAGGCVRDSVLGKEIKDYDVYAWDNSDTRTKLYEFFPDHINITAVEKEGYAQLPMSTFYTGACGPDGKPIQVMLLDKAKVRTCRTLLDYVEQYFDFGICKATYHKLGGAHLTETFRNDVANKTIKFYWSELGRYDEGRASRMQSKFPDYTLDASEAE